jgi:hypothetical protein
MSHLHLHVQTFTFSQVQCQIFVLNTFTRPHIIFLGHVNLSVYIRIICKVTRPPLTPNLFFSGIYKIRKFD